MILTKVVLGKIWDVCAQNRIRALLTGYDSVCNVSLLEPNCHHSPVYSLNRSFTIQRVLLHRMKQLFIQTTRFGPFF